MNNPFEVLEAKIDDLAREVRSLKKTKEAPPADEIGGMAMATSITGLAQRTIYQLTHRRAIPHRRVGGRLYFRRTELEAWLDSGRRKTVNEEAQDRMVGKTVKTQRQGEQPEDHL